MKTELEFDPDIHEYRYDGRVIPNVTSILAPNTDLSMVPAHRLAHAQSRGTAVHRACELHLLNDLDESSLDDEVRAYFWQFLRFLQDSMFHVEHAEQRVYSDRYGYAGTLDLFGRIRRKRVLIDIKTPVKMHPITGPQTAAYEYALREQKNISGKAYIYRYGLKLQADSYELVAFEDPGDFGVFLANKVIYEWRKKHERT